jgi:hypothetical protein
VLVIGSYLDESLQSDLGTMMQRSLFVVRNVDY